MRTDANAAQFPGSEAAGGSVTAGSSEFGSSRGVAVGAQATSARVADVQATAAQAAGAQATGLGPWPGEDVLEACTSIFGELGGENLPFMPLLGGRGAGSDAIGRTLAVLPDVFAETAPYGWRLVPLPGLDHQRLASFWRADLSALETVASRYVSDTVASNTVASGSVDSSSGESVAAPTAALTLKLQFAGPAQLWANLRLGAGERAVRDHGARRDLTEALAQGIADTLREIRTVLPSAQFVLQLDETLVHRVLTGGLKTSSGYQNHRYVPQQEVLQAWRTVIDAARAAGAGTVSLNLLSIAQDQIPWEIVRDASADAVVIEVPKSPRNMDDLSEFIDTGHGVWWATATGDMTSDAPRDVTGDWARDGARDRARNGARGEAMGRAMDGRISVSDHSRALLRWWRDLGFGARELHRLTITHQPGLGSASIVEARSALTRTVQIVDALNEQAHSS